MGAGLEETHRVSEESGKGQAGPGQCWPARALQRTSCREGPLLGGPRFQGCGQVGPHPKLWSGAGRRGRGAAHTCASVTALSDPAGVPGSPCLLCPPLHTGKAGPGIAPHTGPAAGPSDRQRPGPAPRLGNLSHSANSPSALSLTTQLPKPLNRLQTWPGAKTAGPGTPPTTWHPVPAPPLRPPPASLLREGPAVGRGEGLMRSGPGRGGGREAAEGLSGAAALLGAH